MTEQSKQVDAALDTVAEELGPETWSEMVDQAGELEGKLEKIESGKRKTPLSPKEKKLVIAKALKEAEGGVWVDKTEKDKPAKKEWKGKGKERAGGASSSASVKSLSQVLASSKSPAVPDPPGEGVHLGEDLEALSVHSSMVEGRVEVLEGQLAKANDEIAMLRGDHKYLLDELTKLRAEMRSFQAGVKKGDKPSPGPSSGGQLRGKITPGRVLIPAPPAIQDQGGDGVVAGSSSWKKRSIT